MIGEECCLQEVNKGKVDLIWKRNVTMFFFLNKKNEGIWYECEIS